MAERAYSFEEQLELSSLAQKFVCAWLLDGNPHRYRIKSLEGTWKDRRGIDFMVDNREIQFKVDTWIDKSKNFALEVVSNTNKGTVGAGLERGARWWFYLGVPSFTLHILDHWVLLDVVNGPKRKNWKTVPTKTKGRNGEILYGSDSMLIPIADVKELMPEHYIVRDLKAFKDRYGPIKPHS